MTAQINIVHDHFPHWLLSALPNVSPEVVEKRRKAITALIQSLSDVEPDVVVDFARILFELPRRGGVAETRLRKACIDHDPQFANGADAHELAILAGTVLVGLMTHRSLASDAAVLAISCANARGARGTARATPFVSLARDVRRKSAVSAVRESVLPAVPEELLSRNEDRTEAIAEESDDATGLTDYVKQLVDESGELLGQFREELDATWWVVGEYSRDLDTPVRQMPASQAPVILAKEFADMTRSTVGPIAANAVLHRMLGLASELPASLSIADAVEQLPGTWRAAWMKTATRGVPVDGVTPFLAAASRYEELGGNESWRPTFEQTCSLSPGTAFAPLDLATQVYDECLLVRLLASPPRAARVMP